MTTSSGARPGGRRPLVTALLVLAAAAVLSAGTLLGIRWAASHGTKATGTSASRTGFFKLDRPASAIDLPALSGKGTVSVAALAGQPIVVNFWSSTCYPCQKETPALASVARVVGSKVRFVGIDSVDLRSAAARFVTRYKVPYPIAFDPKGTVAGQYRLVGLPVTVFLSRSGKTMLGENIGALTAPKLRAILHRLYGVT
ncbi:MAG: TlpA family protein disulfide reductase [Streptosporangiaceae bacterium]